MELRLELLIDLELLKLLAIKDDLSEEGIEPHHKGRGRKAVRELIKAPGRIDHGLAAGYDRMEKDGVPFLGQRGQHLVLLEVRAEELHNRGDVRGCEGTDARNGEGLDGSGTAGIPWGP